MKIKTWIKYEERYLPKGCRKSRYREREDYINVNLREVDSNDLQLAFEDNSYEGKGEIYYYEGNLYCKTKMPNECIVEHLRERRKIDTPLDYLVWCNENCSKYFLFRWDREEYGKDTSREAVINKAKEDMRDYILVAGELYEKCTEPRYVIITFGLGHNHGGTGMLCQYHYNPNISRKNYFSALQGEQAAAYANQVALERGDTINVGTFRPFIVCHMPELVKINSNKQHGSSKQVKE